MTSLVVEQLRKSYGKQPVLLGLDLVVPDRCLIAILGPSGSGKTTLLRVIAGFERADSGVVRLGDRTVDDGRMCVQPEKRGVGYVPQSAGLFPHLTVEGNVGFGMGRTGHAEQIDDLLAVVGLDGLGKRYPHQLSGGQQQRAALARALAVQPELLLLDEPYAGLDPTLRETVRADVRQILHEKQMTALLVTHDQDEALSSADLVAVVRDGRIAQCGTPQEIYIHPIDPGIARFVGVANVVDGVLDGSTVSTPFGPLPLDPESRVGSAERDVSVLVRPEQIELRLAHEGPGLACRVLRFDYHGHDAVITVRPDRPCGIENIVGRVEATRALEAGSAVRLSVRGSVLAWPSVGSTISP